MAKKIPIEISQIFRFRDLDAASFEAFCGFVAKIPIGISQVLRARGQDPDRNTSSFVAYIDFASFCNFIIKIILLMRQLFVVSCSASWVGYLKLPVGIPQSVVASLYRCRLGCLKFGGFVGKTPCLGYLKLYGIVVKIPAVIPQKFCHFAVKLPVGIS